MTYETKASLLQRGVELMQRFCALNSLSVPPVTTFEPAAWRVNACAYYRPVEIHICPAKCAAIGFAGMSWSFPGHSVDRTPYGVIAHELGHHVDMVRSTKRDRYRGDFSIQLRQLSGHEVPLTSYCPDDGEWFAEMFRLFVTNPDLLAKLRPRTHALLVERFQPAFDDSWRDRLDGAPDRTVLSIERKLAPKPARVARKKSDPVADQPALL